MLHSMVYSAGLIGAAAFNMPDPQVSMRLHAGSSQMPDVVAALKIPEIFPVPTASRCIVIMCCQFMVVYTALAVCRTYHEITGTAKGQVEKGLRAAAQTLTYGPMLCVLFTACRMRVEYLSDGKDEPQLWVQRCMYALTFAVLASTALVLVIPLVTGRQLRLVEGTCDIERPQETESESKVIFYALTFARYMVLLALYGGLAGVIVGTCTYMPPGVKDLNELEVPAPAIACTIILSVIFFSTQLIIAICRSFTEFTGVEVGTIVGLMHAAATTVEFAPMLAVLFLAARMRALQHHAQPQEWAQNCMYASTFAMCLSTLLAMLVPLSLGATLKTNPSTKKAEFEVPNPLIGYVLIVLRFLCTIGFYGGAGGIIYSIFTFQSPAGAAATLPVSPTVQCVVNLTCQFFFVYFMMTVMLTVSEITNGALPMEKWPLFAAIDAARSTLAFAPMLSIVFIACRSYALLITDKKGSPQAWVQDGMFMATWSLMISFLMCLAAGLVMEKVDTDEDGNVVHKFSNKYLGIFMTGIRYLTMTLLYGGMIMVLVGFFVMTPETANGRGAIPLVTDAVNATPVGHPPWPA